MFFVYAALKTPDLLFIPFEKPFILVIASILLTMALGFGVALGTVGAALGRWLPRPARWWASFS